MRTIFSILVMLAAVAIPLYAGGGGGGDSLLAPNEDVLRPFVEGSGTPFIQIDGGINFSFMGVRDSSTRVPTATYRIVQSFESDNPMYKSGNGIGPLFGVTFGYDFPKLFGLRLRVDYDVRTISGSASPTDTSTSFNPFPVFTPIRVDKRYKINASYVSISLLPHIRYEQLYFFIGPTISLPVGKKLTFTETDSIADGGISKFFFGTADSTSVISGSGTLDTLAQTRVSLKIGAGYNIQIANKIFLVPQVAFDFGFTDLMKGDADIQGVTPVSQQPFTTHTLNRKITLTALQLTLGVRFNL